MHRKQTHGFRNKATVLRTLKEGGYRTYIPERLQAGYRKWTDKGGKATAAAFYENRARVGRKKGRALQRKRSEVVERTFAHICETGGARRTRLRGRANVEKRYLLQAAGANLGVLMRTLFGMGTPRGWADRARKALAMPFSAIRARWGRWMDRFRWSGPPHIITGGSTPREDKHELSPYSVAIAA